jgi:shikimate dehydrogenase
MSAQYGIIGYPLTHSFSPAYFTKKFAAENIDAAYTAFPLEQVSDFPALLAQNPQLQGLNVTIPYKQAIIPYLDELDEEARLIGAVNCIAIRDGRTIGYNTDVCGFEQSLKPLLMPQHTHALVLGTGGAAHAVTRALEKLGIADTKVSRSAGPNALCYADLTPELVQHHLLIINTTPLGMHPYTGQFPSIPYDALETSHLLYDLIYNPERTSFLSIGRQYGASIKNGLEMLYLQAEAGWKIWQEK